TPRPGSSLRPGGARASGRYLESERRLRSPEDPGVTPPDAPVAIPTTLPPVVAARRCGWPVPASVWGRRLARITESTPATVGLAIVVVWVGVAALAPVIAPYAPNANDYAALADPRPTARHWLGTDHLGRDLLSRVIWGARTVLMVAPLAVAGAVLLGSLL